MACETEKQYLRAVEKELGVPRAVRKKLIAGLRQELNSTSVQIEELEEPRQVASLLMESVPEELCSKYRIRKRRINRTIISGIGLFLAGLLVVFIYAEKTQVVRAEKHITEDTLQIMEAENDES